MNVLQRIARHTRLTMTNYTSKPSPPFLVLFINSICNMKCEHCFYWTSLNKRDDLTKDELFALSRSLGRIENLNLSGGEPFLRKEFSEICRQFIQHNGVKQIYVPTNGWYTDKTVKAIAETLEEPALELFAAELSLDGMAEFHDRFRVADGAFNKAMATYDALAELQRKDPRLRIHAISTATDVNASNARLASRMEPPHSDADTCGAVPVQGRRAKRGQALGGGVGATERCDTTTSADVATSKVTPRSVVSVGELGT
ncbi:MAG TPA: radical SAM protein, partial [Vicinamibacterales bacterium]|nr:radical SAM protein [Vicinamibacterales bacterium]